MGGVSYLEDVVERMEAGLSKLEVKLRDELSSHPLFSELKSYLDEAKALQEHLEKLIDFAADPEVRWASEAMECAEKLRKIEYENQRLKDEVQKLTKDLEVQAAKHNEEIRRLQEEHKREIEQRKKKWHQWKNMERKKLKKAEQRRREYDRKITELMKQIEDLKAQIKKTTAVTS